MDRDAQCVLRNNQGVSVMTKTVDFHQSGGVVMDKLSSNTVYYLNCQVLAKRDENMNSGMMVLADTGTKEVKTKRNVVSTIVSMIGTVFVVGVAIIGAFVLWKMKPWVSTPE